jgi:hypothetical protein
MKQLTKEEQEQAVELIESIVSSTEKSSIYNRAAFIQSAKTFLQSLRPKIYVGMVNINNLQFFYYEGCSSWVINPKDAYSFKSIDDAIKFKEKHCNEKDDNFRYFILTE